MYSVNSETICFKYLPNKHLIQGVPDFSLMIKLVPMTYEL